MYAWLDAHEKTELELALFSLSYITPTKGMEQLHSRSYLCNVNFIIQLAMKDVAKVGHRICKTKSNTIEPKDLEVATSDD